MKAASGGSAAAGCLRSAALRALVPALPVKTSPCFFCAYVQTEPAMQTRRMCTHKWNNQAVAGMRRSSPSHVKTRMQVQKTSPVDGCCFGCFASITQVILVLPRNIYLITLNYQ